MSRKYMRWDLSVNKEIDGDISYIENQFKDVFGTTPSKSDIIELLVRNFKGKKIKRKAKSRGYICI